MTKYMSENSIKSEREINKKMSPVVTMQMYFDLYNKAHQEEMG